MIVYRVNKENGGYVEYLEPPVNEQYEVVEKEIEEANKPFVPEILSPRQFRLALIHTGNSIPQIESFINNLPEPQRSVVQITWEYSIQFERNDAMFNEFAESLEITQEQLDQIFILGATL